MIGVHLLCGSDVVPRRVALERASYSAQMLTFGPLNATLRHVNFTTHPSVTKGAQGHLLFGGVMQRIITCRGRFERCIMHQMNDLQMLVLRRFVGLENYGCIAFRWNVFAFYEVAPTLYWTAVLLDRIIQSSQANLLQVSQ